MENEQMKNELLSLKVKNEVLRAKLREAGLACNDCAMKVLSLRDEIKTLRKFISDKSITNMVE